ncbi:unnamed protein product [Soboliphyme baturini]|uniref:ULP_PROTEASE domain-containing protein n=1 Tax=Soboliphyme baturini TaxID=241478 RepID=A0A183IQF3_9BILA|nr:unnamed protein product [Soboliphyme baturini]
MKRLNEKKMILNEDDESLKIVYVRIGRRYDRKDETTCCMPKSRDAIDLKGRRLVTDALLGQNPDEVLVEEFDIAITRRDIWSLNWSNWLNDNIMNYYFQLVVTQSSSPIFRIQALSTYFYPKLIENGSSSLSRWMHTPDLFDYHMLLVPIHTPCHWAVAAIDFTQQTICYYDPLGNSNSQCLDALRQSNFRSYLISESVNSFQREMCKSMQLLNMKGTPLQRNECDCGVFACKFAECAAKHAAFNFSQIMQNARFDSACFNGTQIALHFEYIIRKQLAI